jgi:hypothetical protein
MLDRLVAQMALDGPRIDAVVRQFVAAAMPQHVWVDFHVEVGDVGRAFNHGLEAPNRGGGEARRLPRFSSESLVGSPGR